MVPNGSILTGVCRAKGVPVKSLVKRANRVGLTVLRQVLGERHPPGRVSPTHPVCATMAATSVCPGISGWMPV